jgi:Uma2 family endonuclease
MATVTEPLLTAEQYAARPDDGRPSELVRGRIVEMNPPTPRHGQICAKVSRILGNFVEEQGLGQVVSNDSAVVTERNPDSVRGADVAYYSYAKVPKGPLPRGYLQVVPEVVVEVRSEEERWKKIQRKVAEYLEAGVQVICVLDDEPPTLYLYTAEQPVRILEADEEFVIPELLPGFRVPVRRFFE